MLSEALLVQAVCLSEPALRWSKTLQLQAQACTFGQSQSSWPWKYQHMTSHVTDGLLLNHHRLLLTKTAAACAYAIMMHVSRRR